MASLVIGTLMIAATVTIHSVASARWLRVVGRWHETRKSSPGTVYLFLSIVSTGLMLLVLHFVESTLWALVYWVLPSHAGLSSLKEAIYFSTVTFSSLGYGDVTLNPEWQLLGPMEAMVGITVFGITTALLFAVIQRCWQITHERAS